MNGSGWKRSAVVTSLAVALVGGGCRKSISPEYLEAAGLYDALRSAHGEEAVFEPRMAEVEALLARVSSRSLSHGAAQELQKQIVSERARLEGEKKAREEAISEALKPVDARFGPSSSSDARPVPRPDAPVEVPDAGSTQPVPGMSLSEFSQRFSGCFTSGPSLDVLGKGKLSSYTLKDIANCRDRHPGFETRLLLIEKGAILTEIDKSAVPQRPAPILDGGGGASR